MHKRHFKSEVPFVIIMLPHDHHDRGKYCEEAEVKYRESNDIFQSLAGIVACIFLESDKACEGCDKRARSADIYADKKISIVFCKLRKKDRRGYVTDKLAGKRADKERVLVKKPGKEVADNVYTRHISRKDEEEYEG